MVVDSILDPLEQFKVLYFILLEETVEKKNWLMISCKYNCVNIKAR